MGWCTVGMHLDVSSRVVEGSQNGWGEGAFQHCGWFYTNQHQLSAGGAYDHNCGTNQYPENHFASAINASPDSDGASVTVKKNCTRYLNVKPWATGSTGGSDPVGTVLTSDRFFWRYASRNGQWVLGRMERPGTPAYYDWVFVASDCVTRPTTRAPRNT